MTTAVINPFLTGPKIFLTGYNRGVNGAIFTATTLDKLGNIYYGGHIDHSNPKGFLVIKIDKFGSFQWALQSNTGASSGSITLDDMITDPANNDLYIVGRQGSANPGVFYLMKFATNTNPLVFPQPSWQRTFAAPINQPNFYNTGDHLQFNPSARVTIDSTGTYLTMAMHGASSAATNTFIARFYTGNGMFSSQYAVQSTALSLQSAALGGITTSKAPGTLDTVYLGMTAPNYNSGAGIYNRAGVLVRLTGTTTLTVGSALGILPASTARYLTMGELAVDQASGNVHITGGYGLSTIANNNAIWATFNPTLTTLNTARLYGNASTNAVKAHSITVANKPSNNYIFISGYDEGCNSAHLAQFSYDGTTASLNYVVSVANTGGNNRGTGTDVYPVFGRVRTDNNYVYAAGYWSSSYRTGLGIRMQADFSSPSYASYSPANLAYTSLITTNANVNFVVNTSQYSISDPGLSTHTPTVTLATTTFAIGTAGFAVNYQPLSGTPTPNLNIYTISSI